MTQHDQSPKTGRQAHLADARDRRACDRDRAGISRDRTAALRDRIADNADAQIAADERTVRVTGPDPLSAPDLADRAARDRERAAADRAGAAAQRAASARDRMEAARDRAIAAADREHAAAERAAAGVDELTGAAQRDVGLGVLQRELSRAHRTGGPFVLAFVDVDALKLVNDTDGHPAGDRLLKRAAEAVRSHLRPYDVTVRVGGDEFVCGLSGLDFGGVRERFERVSAELATGEDGGSISIGLAELSTDDSLDDLIGRADAALLAAKGAGAGRHRFARASNGDGERPSGLSVMTTRAESVTRLAMEARYCLERRDLYRSKVGGPHAASAERLRGLEREYEAAAGRLASA